MGLNFSFNIYVKKDKLRDSLKFISENCSKIGNHINDQNDKFNSVKEYFSKISERSQLDDDLKKKISFSCSLRFFPDNKILDYIHRQSENEIVPQDERTWKPPFYINGKFEIGSFDIVLTDFENLGRDTFQISIIAVSSKMSRLIQSSNSIIQFFKSFCRELDAKYGYLDKEHEGYQLIWFEGKEYNLDFADKTSLFQKP